MTGDVDFAQFHYIHNRLKYSVILVGSVVGAAFLVVLGFLTWVTLAG